MYLRPLKSSFPPILVAVCFFFSVPVVQGATLFYDDFSQNASDYNQNVQDNTSLSGIVIASMSQASPTYNTIGTLGTENGIATIRSGGTNNAAFVPAYDFATNSDILTSKNFTVTLLGLTPPGGTNWVSLSIFDSETPDGQNITDADLPLGALFRGDDGSGGIQVFINGSGSNPGTTTSGDPINVAFEISNISGYGPNNSFDYRILFDGSNVLDSGTVTGADTSTNYITVESWRGNGTLDGFVVETIIPEPSTFLLSVLGFVALMRGRRS